MSSISFIGSGNMASAIGARAVKGGNAVEMISRDVAKADALARSLGGGATAGKFGAAPAGEIAILSVPYTSAVPVVATVRGCAGRQDHCRRLEHLQRRRHQAGYPGRHFRRAGDR